MSADGLSGTLVCSRIAAGRVSGFMVRGGSQVQSCGSSRVITKLFLFGRSSGAVAGAQPLDFLLTK